MTVGDRRVSAVYEGDVGHVREDVPAYAFRQPVWMLHLDLDERTTVSRHVSLLGWDRPRAVELRAADHFRGRREADLRARLAGVLAGAGLAARGPVRVLTQGRVFGQGFNPVSFWWCHDGHGDLVAAIAEVHNTFGDRHPYVLPAAEAERTATGLAWTVTKRMHVSPFHDLAGAYRFELDPPGDTVSIRAELVRDGVPRVRAGLRARRAPLSDATLARLLVTRPLSPWRVWTSIHAHALHLWRLGARFHPRPPYAPHLVREAAT